MLLNMSYATYFCLWDIWTSDILLNVYSDVGCVTAKYGFPKSMRKLKKLWEGSFTY